MFLGCEKMIIFAHKETTKKVVSIQKQPYCHCLRALLLILALLLWRETLSAQNRLLYRPGARQAVALDCDTALTSDLRVVRRPYKFSDNLFWGIRVSGNRPLVSESDYEEYLRKFRPGEDIFLGKYFNPWISASLNLTYAMQQEELHLPADTSEYSFHSAAFSVEGQLCLNRLFRDYRPDERFSVYAVAGAGVQSSFAFSVDKFYQGSLIDTKTHFAPLFKAGVEFDWRISEANHLTLRGLWTATNSRFCGLTSAHTHRGLELSLGFVQRLSNHYGSRSFQNCRGNEIYYFSMLEDRLLEDHQKQLKHYHKGKAEAPVLAAEEDSILVFPYGYAYLTQRQETKLNAAFQQLSMNPGTVLTIDLYPIVKDDPKMTPIQSIQRCEDAIRLHLKHSIFKIDPNQLRFRHHPDQQSPVEDQSIWIHGAFMHYNAASRTP